MDGSGGARPTGAGRWCADGPVPVALRGGVVEGRTDVELLAFIELAAAAKIAGVGAVLGGRIAGTGCGDAGVVDAGRLPVF